MKGQRNQGCKGYIFMASFCSLLPTVRAEGRVLNSAAGLGVRRPGREMLVGKIKAWERR